MYVRQLQFTLSPGGEYLTDKLAGKTIEFLIRQSNSY